MKKNNRWYDKYKKLAPLLEKFKEMRSAERDASVADVIELIRQHDPRLIEKHVLEFPLELQRRRWYDKNPYLWLLFNGLRFADVKLLEKVARRLAATFRAQRAARGHKQ